MRTRSAHDVLVVHSAQEFAMPSAATSLLTHPATELAELVRSGQVRSRELVEAALERITELHALNAFTLVDAEGALAGADAVVSGDPRPFAGVPIAIKELNAVAGQPLTMGSDLYGDYRPDADAYVVRRLKDAGFVLIGRTAAPEFGILPVTEPRRFGPTRNPWNLDHTPGGSSGGAGASVAAGILPVAHGSDGAGSIRVPAACCGLVGLKPSRGRISPGPDLGDNFLSTNAVLTRTVNDTARLLDIMTGYEIGDATWAPPSSEPFAIAASRAPRPLRIALVTESPLGFPVDPTCVQAARDAAKLLQSLGHIVEEVTPPDWDQRPLIPVFMTVYGAGIASGVAFGAMIRQRPPQPSDVEPLTWSFCQLDATHQGADLLAAMTQLQGRARRMIAFFSTFDMMLTPALGQRPARIGEIDPCSAEPMAAFEQAMAFSPFTAIWNVTGQPAISLPLFQGSDGLPLAVQLVGQPLGDGALLALATQLEAALPWANRMPASVV
jgi:amidase